MNDVLIDGSVGTRTEGLIDSGLDLVLGHGVHAGLLDGRSKGEVVLGVGVATLFRRHGNEKKVADKQNAVDEDEFMDNISLVREKVNDRAVLRAMHFYGENRRAEAEVKALEDGDFEKFKELVTESGRSSYMYNQNVFTSKCKPEFTRLKIA